MSQQGSEEQWNRQTQDGFQSGPRFDYTGPRLIRGLIAAVIAAVVSMFGWYLFVIVTEVEFGMIAWGIGALIGFAAFTGAREGSVSLAATAACLAVVAVIGGQYLAARHFFHAAVRERAAQAYVNDTARAKKVVTLEDEDDIRRFLAKDKSEYEEKKYRSSDISQEELDSFDEDYVKPCEALLQGDPSQEEYIENIVDAVDELVSAIDIMKESASLWTMLWLFLGVSSAFKIGMGRFGKG